MGARPHLITCPPIPQIIGLRRPRATSSAFTTPRNVSPARMRGREFIHSRMLAPGLGTLAKSRTVTLLGRKASG